MKKQAVQFTTINVRRDRGTVAILDELCQVHEELTGFAPRRHDAIHLALVRELERAQNELAGRESRARKRKG